MWRSKDQVKNLLENKKTMTENIEHVDEGKENDPLNIKCRQVSKILEDVDYILIARDEKGEVASANYDTVESLVHMLMGFATRHDPMLKALMIISRIIDRAVDDVNIIKEMSQTKKVDPHSINQ